MRESRGAKIQQRPPVQARGRLWTPAFAGVTDNVLLTHAPFLLRAPAARVARLDCRKRSAGLLRPSYVNDVITRFSRFPPQAGCVSNCRGACAAPRRRRAAGPA